MPIDESSKPTLREVIEEIVEDRFATEHGPQPAQVVAYDAPSQTVTVQPLVKRVRRDPTTGDRVVTTRPVVHDVPILFWGGQKGGITYQVQDGDLVLLLPCGVNLDRWHIGGGLVDPGFVDPDRDSGRLSDCVAVSGLCDVRHQPRQAPTDALVIDSELVKVGGATATEKTLKADSFLSALDNLIAAIGAAVGGITGSGAAAGTAIANALAAFQLALTRNAYKTTNTEVK